MRPGARRHLRPDAPSPKGPLALALAALVVLGFGRWWVARPTGDTTAMLDAGSYVVVIAPTLHRAGCAATTCHGGRGPMRLAPSLVDAASALAEFDAVRPFVASPPSTSPLFLRATSRSHAGAGALSPEGCEARALARWIGGAAVRTCPAPLPGERPWPLIPAL